MTESCKVCGKEFKRMTLSHLKTHGIESMEQYESIGVEKEKDSFDKRKEKKDEVIPVEKVNGIFDDAKLDIKSIDTSNISKVTITPEESTEKIFGKIETNVDKPLKDFLTEFGVTEKELRNIIRTYKDGKPLDVLQDIKRKTEYGENSAESLKDNDKVETKQLAIADALVHKHGFKVEKVTSNPKIWYLHK